MSTLSLRLAKLEGPAGQTAYRPPGISGDDFLNLIVGTVAHLPGLYSASAFEAAVGPWIRAMTPEEAKRLLDAMDALQNLRQPTGIDDSRQFAPAPHGT